MEITHISLKHRKIISAKLIFLESRALLEKKIEVHNIFERLNKLTESLFNLIEEAVPELENNIALDKFLESIVKIFENQIQIYLSIFPVIQKELLAILREKVEEISCTKCSKNFNHLCNGSNKDDEIVNDVGLCISQFHKMFKVAENAAISHYTAYATVPPEYNLPKIHFSTRISSVKPHNYPVDFYVGGTTYFHNSEIVSSRIELILNPNSFDSFSYEAILYVLFHECIVHAYHGFLPTVDKRINPTADDSFSEGWMDWVAFKIMENVLQGNCIDLCQPIGILELNKTRHRGEEFHSAKASYNVKQKADNAYKIFAGKQAAEKVFKLISQRKEVCKKPWEAFLKLSFNLNMMSDFPQDQRNAFIGQLQQRLVENEDLQEDLPPKHTKYAGFITEYLIDDDIEKLIRLVCK